uniref:F-box domain-containing protein n=1 Tax=Cannabis sativa TaxID=3483 RepID=A0A803QX17_CANSA
MDDQRRVETRSMMMVEEEEDRISKLPDAIIVHILSFLPTKDVVRTCLLSNRWKLIWYLVPKLSFSNTESHFQEEFFNFVDKCLEHCKTSRHFILESMLSTFELRMKFYERHLVSRLDKWLGFAVDHKVQKINLSLAIDVSENYPIFYSLPKTLVINSKYLTILELTKVELDSSYSFDFPSLKLLSLHFVRFADTDVVDKLLLGSPSLESLQLCHLQRPYPDQLHIRSSSLKFLQIKCHIDIPVQLEVINLETLELFGVSFEKTNLSVCKAIKNLLLICVRGAEESSSSLEYLISNFHQLENLTLCDLVLLRSKHLKISNHHLKSLKLRFISPFKDETKVIIEAPKLVSFCYEGHINHNISIGSSNLLNGKFIILNHYKKYDAKWFIDMMIFLVNLNCSMNIVSLHIDSEKAFIFPQKMKKICRTPLVNWEHLRVFTKCKLEMESTLRDALLWISPSLKSLTLVERASTN